MNVKEIQDLILESEGDKNLLKGFRCDTVNNWLKREMKIVSRLKYTFKRCVERLNRAENVFKLESLPESIQNEKFNWNKGKNYDWILISYKNHNVIIRKYGTHFTICLIHNFEFYGYELYTDTEKLTKDNCPKEALEYGEEYLADFFCDNREWMLREHLLVLFEACDNVQEDRDLCLYDVEYPHLPEHTSLYVSIDRYENICSVDKTIFLAEELDRLYSNLFAENDMIDMLNLIQDKELHKVSVERKNDDNYHGVGMYIDGKFTDIYSLTDRYLDRVRNILTEQSEEEK